MSESILAAIIGNMILVVPLGIAAFAAIFMYRRSSPVLRLQLSARWPSRSDHLVVLAFEVENVGSVRVYREKAAVRVVEFDPLAPPRSPQDEKEVACIGGDYLHITPGKLVPPEAEILKSTEFLSPGETIHVERMYRLPPSGMCHVAMQFLKRRRFQWGRPARRQTATWYVSRTVEPG
jgi:hypothetical protein